MWPLRFFRCSFWRTGHYLMYFGMSSVMHVWHIRNTTLMNRMSLFLLKLRIAQGHKTQTVGLKLTLSISSFHVWGSHLQDADILPFLHPCLHSFLYPIICLKCLIFFLHLRACWLLMADLFPSDGTFLGEIHFLSAWFVTVKYSYKWYMDVLLYSCPKLYKCYDRPASTNNEIEKVTWGLLTYTTLMYLYILCTQGSPTSGI